MKGTSMANRRVLQVVDAILGSYDSTTCSK
jgi:hypothetical protein